MPDGQEAYLSFERRSEKHIAIDYSFVPPPFRGRGVAAMLVLRAVQDARESGTTITPLCGYVAAEFRRHKEWQDVLGRLISVLSGPRSARARRRPHRARR